MVKWFYYFGRWLTGVFLHLWYDVTYIGTENQPENGGYILCCNHRKAIDPILLAQKIKNPIRFMSKAELFKSRLPAKILSALGAFPVDRGTGDMGAINVAINSVRDGYVLGVFPEGTRAKTEDLLRFKSGAVVIAAQSGGDLLPASIWYSGNRFRSKVVIRFGKMIPNDAFAIEGISGRQIKAAVNLVKGEVEKLLEETKQCGSK